MAGADNISWAPGDGFFIQSRPPHQSTYYNYKRFQKTRMTITIRHPLNIYRDMLFSFVVKVTHFRASSLVSKFGIDATLPSLDLAI